MKIIASLTLSAFLGPPILAAEPSYREAALEAARWIRASTVQTNPGITWLADPRDPKSASNSLYAGSPGVILFFLEAYHSTGDESFLKDARAGADSLLAVLAGERNLDSTK